MLRRLSNEFAKAWQSWKRVHKMAGQPFNIGSPKQLGEILFDKMSLDGGKKTKTGAWSTGADVLEELAAQGHDLAPNVLDWRGFRSCAAPIPMRCQLINPKTGRVHTSYALAATSTGRLSSTDPNLQNIPDPHRRGPQNPHGVHRRKGPKLISADYSQIELRLLAHIADIPR